MHWEHLWKDTDSARALAQPSVHHLFSPQRYLERWTWDKPEGQGRGGVTLAELEASGVRDPRDPSRVWLLHRRVFESRLVRHAGTQRLVADPEQQVPVCRECRSALAKAKPQLPPFALANDFWVGQMPSVEVKEAVGKEGGVHPGRADRKFKSFGALRRGTLWLLQLARPVMRQVYMSSAAWKKSVKETHAAVKVRSQRGLGSNAVVFTQADARLGLQTLPPSALDLADRLSIVFTPEDVEQVAHALRKEVSKAEWDAAFLELQERCPAYAWAQRNVEAEADLEESAQKGKTGFPRIFRHCAAPLRLAKALKLQRGGPAQATRRGMAARCVAKPMAGASAAEGNAPEGGTVQEEPAAAAQSTRRGFKLISHVSRNRDWRANRRARGPRRWRRRQGWEGGCRGRRGRRPQRRCRPPSG